MLNRFILRTRRKRRRKKKEREKERKREREKERERRKKKEEPQNGERGSQPVKKTHSRQGAPLIGQRPDAGWRRSLSLSDPPVFTPSPRVGGRKFSFRAGTTSWYRQWFASCLRLNSQTDNTETAAAPHLHITCMRREQRVHAHCRLCVRPLLILNFTVCTIAATIVLLCK